MTYPRAVFSTVTHSHTADRLFIVRCAHGRTSVGVTERLDKWPMVALLTVLDLLARRHMAERRCDCATDLLERRA